MDIAVSERVRAHVRLTLKGQTELGILMTLQVALNFTKCVLTMNSSWISLKAQIAQNAENPHYFKKPGAH